jgi:hypothetical protein
VEYVRLILALVKAGLPVPTFTDRDAVEAWLDGLNGPLADTIATVASKVSDKDVQICCDDPELMAEAAKAGISPETLAWLAKMAEILGPVLLTLLTKLLTKKSEPVNPVVG